LFLWPPVPFIAHPASSGYTGIHVQLDGVPSHVVRRWMPTKQAFTVPTKIAANGGVGSAGWGGREQPATGENRDATLLAVDAVGAYTADFLASAWRQFLTVLDRAPVLLDRCRPTTPWPKDAQALVHLATALLDAGTARKNQASGSPLTRTEHNART
jgi:hypothetical protein